MKKKLKEKQYALIKKGAISPIIVSDYETIKHLYDTSTPAQKNVLKIEEVLNQKGAINYVQLVKKDCQKD